MLAITREQFKSICGRYKSLFILKDDAEEAIDFVRELLEEEASALQQMNPLAIDSIRETENMAYQLLELRQAISAEQFRNDSPKERFG